MRLCDLEVHRPEKADDGANSSLGCSSKMSLGAFLTAEESGPRRDIERSSHADAVRMRPGGGRDEVGFSRR